jgi:hypothetical protein
MNRPGVPESVLGCLGSNMDVGFSDDADNTAEDFENACDSGAFAITGEYQPINPLSTYIGQSSKGIWFFEIQDFKAGNGGQMTSWELEICSLSTPDESLTVETDTFYVNKGAALPITNEKIFTADVDPSMMRYTVTQLPEFGTLDLMDENGVVTTLELGSLFTQDDIDANRLAFQSFDIETDDSFNFNALSSEDIWLANNILPIRIYGPSSVDNEIDDLDLIISPNPGSGVFHFYFNTDRSQEMNLHVYSIQGKLLMSDHIQINDGSTHRIDMSELSAGIYFVAVENEAGARNTYRLIKQ